MREKTKVRKLEFDLELMRSSPAPTLDQVVNGPGCPVCNYGKSVIQLKHVFALAHIAGVLRGGKGDAYALLQNLISDMERDALGPWDEISK
jgi:hydrogenase maturation factor